MGCCQVPERGAVLAVAENIPDAGAVPVLDRHTLMAPSEYSSRSQ